MKFRIEQKILSLTDSFDIDDEDGRLAFTVKGKFFSISSSQTMYDLAEREVLKIKRKYLSILPACRLVAPSGEEWLVRKKFWPFWRASFSVQTPQGTLEIDGNLWQREYRITQNDQLLARVFGISLLFSALAAIGFVFVFGQPASLHLSVHNGLMAFLDNQASPLF